MRKVVLVLVVALAASACNLGTEEGSDTSAQGPTSSPDNGSEALESREDRLPDNFPGDFPLPDNHRVLYSQFDEGQGSLVFFSVNMSDADLVEFFTEQLAQDDWLVLDCTAVDRSPGPATVIFAQKRDTYATTTIGNLPTKVDVADWSFYVAVIPVEDQSLPDQTPAPCPSQ